MTLFCELEKVGDEMVCQRCGERLPVKQGVLRYTAVCRAGDNYEKHQQAATAASQPVGDGLGDKVEAMLTAIGITKSRYKQVKKKFGLPPECQCDAVQEWLNRVSDWWRGEAT